MTPTRKPPTPEEMRAAQDALRESTDAIITTQASSAASGRDDAEWVCAVINYLVLNERPSVLDEYVSKPE